MAKNKPLPLKWFRQDATLIAPALIGKVLVRKLSDGTTKRFTIIETEAYMPDDPASHSFKGPNLRNASMFARAGTIYVYMIYGIHYCLNLTTGDGSPGQAVLIRAVSPLGKSDLPKDYSGPGKLCKALGISKALDGQLATSRGTLWIEDGPADKELKLTASTRIGINKATDKLWRWRRS